ncbi:hypothetical protein DMUE_5692 [Dictyocoela muelleri]|nr:hypothetical protein EQH57_0745 [Dictyocoela roeselum]KAG0430117.1 hypothetical protein DMUE_5692 [Dictyocoela muelleri]
MIEVRKIMKGKENVDRASFLTLDANVVTRNKGYKFVEKRFTPNITHNFFECRVVGERYKLLAKVVNSDIIETFKSWLYKSTRITVKYLHAIARSPAFSLKKGSDIDTRTVKL